MIDRRRVDDLLDQALDLPAEERSAFLDHACETLELRAVVDRLLDRAVLATAPKLGDGLWREMAGKLRGGELEPGDVVGAYRVVHELGRGGMAVVYLAERADGQFEQKVALKILERPAEDELAVRRFHLERQILATLDHPHIARLFDGGIAPDGRPYFILEWVDGVPIDQYCDAKALTLRQRLELFAQVGRAVAAAHRLLVVHRDIKPSNILVSHDGVPKLLDFGIAKLIEAEGTLPPASALTHTAMFVMTPAYASPEQLRGEAVSTASDVYQLGLLLYELLAGAHAFRFDTSTPQALRADAATREPTAPSAAALEAAPEGKGEDRARRRGCSSLAELRRLLVGDLDTIVLAALKPAVERRYDSVIRLVEDVERFLANQPIRARPDSLLYRLNRFVARHRLPVAVSSAALLALAGLGSYSALRVRRERDLAVKERAKAEKVADFLVGLFQGADPVKNRRVAERTALELLDEGAERVERELGSEPEVEAALLHTLGSVYRSAVRLDKAEPLIERAVALRRQHLGEQAPETLDSLALKATLLTSRDQPEEALALSSEVLARRIEVLGEGHPVVARNLAEISSLLHRLERFDEARERAERALGVLGRLPAADPLLRAQAERSLAMALSRLERHEEALPHFERVVALTREHAPPGSSLLGPRLAEYGVELRILGRQDEARQALQQAVAVMEDAIGPDEPRTAVQRLSLADCELALEHVDEALVMIERSLPAIEQGFGRNHFWYGLGHRHKMRALEGLGRYREALAAADTAESVLRAAFGPASPDVFLVEMGQARLRFALGRREEAIALLRGALLRAEGLPQLGPWVRVDLLSDLADLELQRGGTAAAEEASRQAIALLAGEGTVAAPASAQAHHRLAESLAAQGRNDEALAAVRKALELMNQVTTISPSAREAALELERRLVQNRGPTPPPP